MTPPRTLIRDAALAALVVVAVACCFGRTAGAGSLIGAVAGLVNLRVLVLASWLVARSGVPALLGGKTLVGAVLLLPLLTILPPIAVMAGFFAPLLAFSARGVMQAAMPKES